MKKLKGFKAIRRALNKKTAAVIASPFQAHIRTTLSVLQSVLDIDNTDPMIANAFRAHCEAVELATNAA